MKVLIVGCRGQLGYELQRTQPEKATVVALDTRGLDLTNAAQVDAVVAEHRPSVVINAAAYTAVDKAESEEKLAFAVNADGAGHLARAAADAGAYLVHVSTDFIFDGSASRPYPPQTPANPLSVYGASKAAGERQVQDALGEAALILRTAWVYSAHGKNFVKTMLRLMTEREELRVVADQIGSPTWANGLAHAIWQAAELRLGGVHHWTDSGVASWYDLAVAIEEEGRALGLLARPTAVRPIRTEDYPTPAHRPAYSVLDKTETWQALSLSGCHWRQALRQMLSELRANQAA
jgi:dTDP-4-dehydrorhamnose reductase